jgi:DNA-binding LacI/PurR family transcriptional regulator
MAEPVAGPPRRPTIRDVAERAGVSKSLVSLVLRGEPLVRDDKRRRVQQAAAELGYRTSWAARSLSAVRSGTVGVLAADLRNPWSMDIVEAIGQALVAPRLVVRASSARRCSGGPGMSPPDLGNRTGERPAEGAGKDQA